MKLPAAILLALVATPAFAGGPSWLYTPKPPSSGGWSAPAAKPRQWVEPELKPSTPVIPLSWIFPQSMPPCAAPPSKTPNGINYIVPGARIDPKTGWIDHKSVNMWPPKEFDHPYKGDLTIIRTSIQHVKELCPPMQTGFAPLGCAYQDSGRFTYCKLILAHDADIRALGSDPEEVFRHEQGHCNGWPADHTGARNAP